MNAYADPKKVVLEPKISDVKVPPAPARNSRRRALKRVLLASAPLALLAGVSNYGWHYWQVGRFQVSTDDAYVKADSTTVAPKVSGYIGEVLVSDNQPVKAGQVLARIDDRDFRDALDQAHSEVAAADAAVQNDDAQISLQQALIAQAVSNVTAMRASLGFAQADAARYHELAGTGFGTVQRAQQTQAARDQTTAQLMSNEAAVLAEQRKVAVLTTARSEAIAQADHARAVMHQAELNLGYTTITASVDGVVGNRTLRVGQYVQAGTQLMSVVPLNAVYVVANFKETQLTSVRPGQPAEVKVDTFSGTTLHGHVDSIAPASGQEFALLPPDNATGNFTKIVQRVPVKVVLDPDPALANLLRPGMSVVPTIDTKTLIPAR